MARALVPTATPSPDGVAAATAATGDPVEGHYTPNTERTVIEVTNTDAGGAHTVTFITPVTVGGKAVDDQEVSIAASTTRVFGHFPTSLYGTTLQIDVETDDLTLRALQA
jgi:hypothetical protein